MNSTFNVDDVKIWWKHEDGCLKKDLKPFKNDEDASLLALFTEKNNCEVEIYTEPKLSTSDLTYMERLTKKQKGHESFEDSDSSEVSMNGI